METNQNTVSEHRIPLSAMCRPHAEELAIDSLGGWRGSYGFLEEARADLKFEM